MFFQFVIATLLAVCVSVALNRMMIHLAPKVGLMDQPGARRIHQTPIPRAGGIAIWLSFLIVISAGLATGLIDPGGNLSWKWLGAFTASSGVLMIAGILDDRHGLTPFIKLGAHALAPIFFLTLHPIDNWLFPDSWPDGLDKVAFVIWAVVLINAFNLIDGLDGLCGGLAAVATLGLAGIALSNERTDAALLLLVMGGAILGFLRYNFNPARIFLGDAGSMLIGLFLATAATDAVGRRAVAGMILLPIAVAGVPLLDVLLAIWRRGARRIVRKLRGEDDASGIFDADRDHLHHRLLDSKGSQRKVALILQGIAILLAMLAFLPMMFGDRVLVFSLIGLIIVALVGIRHFARVELVQTGSVIHMAIKLPVRSRMLAASLFAYDLLALVCAASCAVLIETNFLTRPSGIPPLQFAAIFTIFGGLATLFARVHLTLWVRATMRQLIGLFFWLLIAALATFTLFSLAAGDTQWSNLRMALLAHVFASIAICIPRGFLDVCREYALEAYHGNPRQPENDAADGFGPVAVLGAGDFGTLFLDHLKSSSHGDYPDMRILGFLDESKALHGRRLRSFRILGGISEIPQLVETRGLRGIIVAINHPSRELLDTLTAYATRHQLKIHHWNVGLQSIPVETPPGDQDKQPPDGSTPKDLELFAR